MNSLNLTLVILALLGGFSAFLSPCAFPLLPVYIVNWIGEKWMKKSLTIGLKSGLTISIGLEIILIIFVLIPIYLIEKVVSIIPTIGVALGIFLIAFGIVNLSGKVPMSIQIWFKGLKNIENLYVKQFFYGLIYAFNSLTCSLPILLMVLSAPLVGGEPLVLFIAFSTGMITPMFLLTVFSSFIGEILIKKFKGILPYIEKIEATIAIIAGLYLTLTNLNI
jgi:cytochrome c-type biogenesis protein